MTRERRERGGEAADQEGMGVGQPELTPGKRSGTAFAPDLSPPRAPGKRTLTQHFAPRATRTGDLRPLLADSAPLEPGQMLKQEFIQLLEQNLIQIVEAEAGAGAAIGCPYIERYIGKYSNLPAARGEALLRRWIPAVDNLQDARGLLPLVQMRVREAVKVWSTTGALPRELAGADPELASTATPKSLEQMEQQLGEGQAIDAGTASRMSKVVGSDVSGARVHTGPVAQGLAAEHGAVAFAVGQNVVMGASAPSSGIDADALLAHELAHTAQQKDAAKDPVARRKPIGEEDAAAEQDAGKERLSAFAVGFGEVMRTGLQLQRCGGIDPSYQPASKAVGPDVGKLAYVSHPQASGWFNRHEGHVGTTLAASTDEAQALALAKTLGRNVVIAASGGQYFLYQLELGGDLDIELVYGHNAGLQLQAGIFAIVSSRGLVYRGSADQQINNASPDRGASSDPWSAYQKLNASKGGLEKLSEPELIATFQAAMYDTAMSVLATSEAEARDKQKQFSTPGATAKEEAATIDATARELLDIQKKIEWLEDEFEAHKGMSRGVPDQRKQQQLKAEIERGEKIKRQKVRAYPMLGRYKRAKDLQAFVDKSPADREKSLAGDADSVLSDVHETRANIQTGDLNLWNVPSIVDATMAGLGIGEASPAREKIKSKASAVSTKETVLSIALGVFSLGFGIASAVLTGGASLAFAAGALGLGAYDAIKTTEEHFVTNAATGTDLDPDDGLLPEEARRSWGWLVVAWAGVALDFADVLKAAAVADEVGKIAKGAKSISEGAEVLAKGDKKLLDRLRKAAGEADLGETITEAMRPGLSGRVGAPIKIDGNLGGSVKVLYQVDDTGRTLVTGMRVGPKATVGDILAHADTVSMLDRYSGLTGRIRQLWDRLRSFAGKTVRTNPFPAGSKAFESWQELEKLQGLVSYRRAQLTELLEKAPAATDAQAALRKEIAFLENEANIHARVVDGLVLEKGTGIVAMETSTKEALESGRRLPDVPGKGADDITADELANSAYYYERDGDTFILKEKLDRKGVPQPVKPEAPKPLGSDQVAALRASLTDPLPRAVVDLLDEQALVALDKLDRSVLKQLRRADRTVLDRLARLLIEDPELGGRLVGKPDLFGTLLKLPDGARVIDLDRKLFLRRLTGLGLNEKRLMPAVERVSGEDLAKLTDGDLKNIAAGDAALAKGRERMRPGTVSPESIPRAQALLDDIRGVPQSTIDEIRASIAHQHGLSDLPFMSNPGAALRTKFPGIPTASMDELVKRHPDALRALEQASQEDVERVIRALGKSDNPKDVEDILRSYMYKAQKKVRKEGEALEPPSSVGARVEESVGNLTEARTRGFPFGFKDKSQYDQFMAKLQSELGARKIKGTPKVQGSAMHSKTPGDVDLEILVDQPEFDRLAARFLEHAPEELADELKRSIGKQKIPSTQFFPDHKPSIAAVVRPLTGIDAPLDVQATLIVKGSDFDLGPFL